MHSILGFAPILDFDGTVAVLPVDWAGLRRRLQVARIDDLWQTGRIDDWSVVTNAEVEAAGGAVPLEPVLAALADVETFAILTSNSERAVLRFFEDRQALRSRLASIVGRETLAGPKADEDVFRAGFTVCLEATAAARRGGQALYVGDADYELEFARNLGVRAVHVSELIAPRPAGHEPLGS